MQSPAPASNLAEARPAASPQLGRRICQHGLRSARVGCLLLVLAAASAAAVLLLLCCCCAAAVLLLPRRLLLLWSQFVLVRYFSS